MKKIFSRLARVFSRLAGKKESDLRRRVEEVRQWYSQGGMMETSCAGVAIVLGDVLAGRQWRRP